MDKINVTTPRCMQCNEVSIVQVHPDSYRMWQKGWYIQDCFPDWSADERELLKSGTHPECWDAMMEDE